VFLNSPHTCPPTPLRFGDCSGGQCQGRTQHLSWPLRAVPGRTQRFHHERENSRKSVKFVAEICLKVKPTESKRNFKTLSQKGPRDMIARVWKGWTSPENADAYEKLLREVVYPALQKINGYRGGYILRQDGGDETEFVTVNLFESLEAVRAFAGPDYDKPVFEPEARRLLSKVEPIAHHYDVKKAP